jgi:signal transduction histidine kinase
MTPALDLERLLARVAELELLLAGEKARADRLEAEKKAFETSVDRMMEAENARETFLSNCSHELRTPLTPIIGWARLLQTKPMNGEEVREVAQTIEREGRRLLDVVNSILAAAAISRDYERSLQVRPEDLQELIRRAVSRFPQERLKVEVDQAARRVTVYDQYVTEAIGYLVDNACKFAPGSPVAIRAAREDDEVVVTVRDWGPGVPEEKRDQIFLPFTQGESGNTRRYGGLGNGLYLAKQFIEAHGGHMYLEDTCTPGAAFTFSLPQRRPADWGDGRESQRTPEGLLV